MAMCRLFVGSERVLINFNIVITFKDENKGDSESYVWDVCGKSLSGDGVWGLT